MLLENHVNRTLTENQKRLLVSGQNPECSDCILRSMGQLGQLTRDIFRAINA